MEELWWLACCCLSIDDRRCNDMKSADGEEGFFVNDAAKPAVVSDQRKADQKRVDAAIRRTLLCSMQDDFIVFVVSSRVEELEA